ncbi:MULTISPECIES: hypothetical protein [unclassified Paracoccus (in: a-proteobacteria)]|nr:MULTISPECIES: hypothetical protein [unclassified Paracoccus (in: a-proteobacteria)]MBB1491231.1 hypothetical protein [Paracoccus sp. MC1854]MBB1498011.1 hypothetical protein [Paracoccus sp. MC1862]QQO43543.1 hypothetical protein JGR78_08680 [Paracoccus sp. MC1862]
MAEMRPRRASISQSHLSTSEFWTIFLLLGPDKNIPGKPCNAWQGQRPI